MLKIIFTILHTPFLSLLHVCVSVDVNGMPLFVFVSYFQRSVCCFLVNVHFTRIKLSITTCDMGARLFELLQCVVMQNTNGLEPTKRTELVTHPSINENAPFL